MRPHSSPPPLLMLVASIVCPGLASHVVAGGLETAPAAIEQYLAIRTATVAGLSPDAKTVAFLTNTTGSNQIWTVPADGGWPDQITFFSDRVSGVSWSPRGDWIAFSRDSGGDENYQLYLVAPDGSKLVRLTDAPAVRHNFGGWSRDGRWISYSSNARNKKFFDVYRLNVDTGDRKLLHEADALFSAGPFSNDGASLILVRANASLDNDLFVLPLAEDADGRRRSPVHLTPHEGKARYDPVGWSADDKALWIVSDAAREFTGLARVQIPSGTFTWALEPPWDVSSAALSRDGKVLAVVVNEDGYETVTVRDAATLEPRSKAAIPKGSASALRISQDSSVLALTLGGAARNPDVWLVNLDTGRLGQVTRSSTAGIPPSTFVEPRLIRHKTFDDRQIPAFLYLPVADGKSGKPPCLVLPHGGPESQTKASFSGTTQFWISRGYAVWAPNVRGSTGYGRTVTHLDDVRRREDSVKDLAAGVAWLKESGLVDPNRIAVTGGSYGGYMTLAAITLYPDLWAAAVDSYGIANFRSFLRETAAYRVGLRASEYGDPVADADFLDSISPLHKADRIRAPLLVLQGANDPRVPRVEAEQIVAAVKKNGGTVEYVLFPDEGHGWTKLTNQITALRTTAEFLDKHLKNTPHKPGSP